MILAAIVGFIYEVSVLHITIQDTNNDLKSWKIEIQDEFVLRDQRSDKRYSRAMNLAKDLKVEQEQLEKELEKHLIEDAYERGLNDMYRKMKE